MTGLQEIAINNIIRSAVSIQHDFKAPRYDERNRYQLAYTVKNRNTINERKRSKKKRVKLQINPKLGKCYGG